MLVPVGRLPRGRLQKVIDVFFDVSFEVWKVVSGIAIGATLSEGRLKLLIMFL